MSDNRVVQFIEKNGNGLSLSYGRNHEQLWTLFTIVSQHVNAPTIERCFEKAIEIEEGKKKET